MLTPADIEAIANAVVRKLDEREQVKDDMQYLATLPPDEIKRRLKERRAQHAK